MVLMYSNAVLRASRQNQATVPNAHGTDKHTLTGIMFRHRTRVEVFNHVIFTVYLVLIKMMPSSERPLGDNLIDSKGGNELSKRWPTSPRRGFATR